MKTIVFSCLIAFSMQAFEPPILSLWPARPPGPSAKVQGAERDLTKPADKFIAGRPVISLGHVNIPKMQAYPPDKAKANGESVLLCPGGGFPFFAWDLEGTEVAEWMNSLALAPPYSAWLGDQPGFGKGEHRADKKWPLHAMLDEPGHNNQPYDSTRTLPQLIADLKARPCDVLVLANPLEMLADEDIDVSSARTLDFLCDEARRKQARLVLAAHGAHFDDLGARGSARLEPVAKKHDATICPWWRAMKTVALARPDSILLGDTAKGHPAIGSIHLNVCCFLFALPTRLQKKQAFLWSVTDGIRRLDFIRWTCGMRRSSNTQSGMTGGRYEASHTHRARRGPHYFAGIPVSRI